MELSATFPVADGIMSANLPVLLRVKSEDVLEAVSGKDSDIVIVKAGMPIIFILGAGIYGQLFTLTISPQKMSKFHMKR